MSDQQEASQFALGVMKSLDTTWDSAVLKKYEDDAATGHLAPGKKDKSTTKSTAKVFSTMKKSRG